MSQNFFFGQDPQSYPAMNDSADPFREARLRLVKGFATGPDAICDPRVLEAMRDTPRHWFVPESLWQEAYWDKPVAIGFGQTISQPSLVAFMTERLCPRPTDRVLEIGTGSGYQAAILARLVAEVYSIEIVEPLAQRAREVVERLGLRNVHLRTGDGHLGWPEAAPFDAVVVTCAPDAVPPALVEQLREGGRMVVPVGTQEKAQTLYVMEKREGRLREEAVLPVRFVPMTGGAGE